MEKKFNHLNIDGTKYKTQLTKKFENRKVWEKPDENQLRSFIPGTIVKINVKEGQKVKEGNVLLILEAMKVQNKIQAPRSGVIKKINIEVGEKIPKDHLLLEIE